MSRTGYGTNEKKHNIFYTVDFANGFQLLPEESRKVQAENDKAHEIAITKCNLEIQNKHKLIINITQERDLEENKRKIWSLDIEARWINLKEASKSQ